MTTWLMRKIDLPHADSRAKPAAVDARSLECNLFAAGFPSHVIFFYSHPVRLSLEKRTGRMNTR